MIKKNVGVQLGFSLIEIILAIALAALLLEQTFRTVVLIKYQWRLRSTQIELQNRFRILAILLPRYIQLAGYTGCVARSKSIQLTQNLHAYVNPKKSKTDILVVATCMRLAGKAALQQVAFYVANDGLYMQRVGGRAEQVVAGISNMRLRFGILNKKGDAIVQYQSAHTIKDWRQVASVELHMLLHTSGDILAKPMQYWFAGKKYVAPDRKWYQELTLYVALREPQPTR